MPCAALLESRGAAYFAQGAGNEGSVSGGNVGAGGGAGNEIQGSDDGEKEGEGVGGGGGEGVGGDRDGRITGLENGVAGAQIH